MNACHIHPAFRVPTRQTTLIFSRLPSAEFDPSAQQATERANSHAVQRRRSILATAAPKSDPINDFSAWCLKHSSSAADDRDRAQPRDRGSRF